jgi:hypothetical protein
MAAWLRPSEKLAKVAYKILKTPKELRQRNDKEPSDKRIEAWKINTSTTS